MENEVCQPNKNYAEHQHILHTRRKKEIRCLDLLNEDTQSEMTEWFFSLRNWQFIIYIFPRIHQQKMLTQNHRSH